MTPGNNTSPKEIYLKIATNIEKVMRGQTAAIKKLLAAFASGGHVLLEDYPGTESEFYLIEKRLYEWELTRHHWEPLSDWLQRIKESQPSREVPASMDAILALHYRYRFDPKGITETEKSLLKSKVASWLEQSSGEIQPS